MRTQSPSLTEDRGDLLTVIVWTGHLVFFTTFKSVAARKKEAIIIFHALLYDSWKYCPQFIHIALG